MNIRIKICGITCENDIKILNTYLPDYAGFVFAESKRKVSKETAKNLGDGLDLRVKRVGVFVDMEVTLLAEIAQKAGLDAVQLHGNETQEYVDSLRSLLGEKKEIWKAARIAGAQNLKEMQMIKADRYLTDAYVEGISGGSGIRFDWGLLQGFNNGSMILAGGLSPYNIREAITGVRPFGVDVSSGVERDGKKDEILVKEFIYRARTGMEE